MSVPKMHKARLESKPGFVIELGIIFAQSLSEIGYKIYFFPKSPGLPNKPPPVSLLLPPRSGSFRLRSYC